MKRGLVSDTDYLVARSQAKQLCLRFDKFQKVILDFSGVTDIGQGFAHEIFCVFANKHPETIIECINTNQDIDNMIRHVL